MRLIFVLISFLLFSANENIYGQETASTLQISWEKLSAIPPQKGQAQQPGLAGAFIGVHNDVLLIAGGANFPNGPAWEGGEKVYHSDICIEKKRKGL